MSASEPLPETPPLPLSRNRDFVCFVTCRAAAVIGTHAFSVAIGWHVYKLSGDPFDLGLIGLAQFAPAFVLFLVAGMAADTFDRRAIIVVCSVLHTAVVGVIGALIWSGVATVGILLALLLLQGTARSFFHTSAQAILPNLVGKAQFPSAIAYASSTYKAATLVGPAAGGFLIAWADDTVFLAIVACYIVSGISALLLRKRLRVESPAPVTLETVTDGFRYVWRNKVVLGAMSIDLLAVLFGGIMGLLPAFASDILHVGADGLGIMRAMPGAGALLVGLLLTRVRAPRHMGIGLFLSVGLFGASVIGFSLSETYWLSLALLAVYGGADMISVYVRQTLIQLATPDNMRGRVSAINAVSINASNELGDFRAGITAGFIGSVGAVLVGGAATIAVAALWWRLFPAIRRIDTVDQAHRS